MTRDEHLAEIIARRDSSDRAMDAAKRAFDELYDRHAHPLLAFLATRVRPGDRDDLHQEVWHRVWHHLPDGFRGGNLRAWLFQIARNLVIDRRRKPRQEAIDADESVVDTRSGPAEALLIEKEHREILRRCLERLQPGVAALVRRRLAGETYPEICQGLGLEPARAHRLFHRAKELLQDCVERAMA